MKSKAIFGLVLFFGMAALAYAERLRPSIPNVLPTSLDGKAYEILQTGDDKPMLREVSTAVPVLFYAGKSINRTSKAYTSLSLYDELAPNGRRTLTSKELVLLAQPHLVPSGDLLVEDDTGRLSKVNDPQQYVVAAAWSPIDANVLAFTFSSGSDYGVAVVNIKSKKIDVLRPNDILPDRVAWSRSGVGVQFYERDSAIKGSGDFGEEVSRFALAEERVAGAKHEKAEWSLQLPRVEDLKSTSRQSQAFELALPDGTRFKGDDFLGRSQAQLFNPAGRLVQRVTADIVIGLLPVGVAYKVVTPDSAEIKFINRDGHVSSLAAAASTVRYFLPFMPFANPGLTVTQSGSGYSPQCSVWDHTGSMAYAYDMQAVAGNETIESAADGTVAYLAKSVSCNSLDNGSDGSRCADYSSACTGTASNSGWGNVIILQHADGTWTKYTHLKYGSVLPPSTGVSVAYGCELARQGHTGATKGFTNGCGDHLHFQRQVSSAVGGSSTSITFADQATNPLRCTTYRSGNQGRSCLFR